MKKIISISIVSVLIGFSIGFLLNDLMAENEFSLDQFTGINFETKGCDSVRCLFTSKDGSITAGYATIQGYYSTFERESRSGDMTTCNAFTMVDGPEEIIDGLWEQTEEGNAFGIFFTNLSEDEESTILASTKENPIEVKIISQYYMSGKGAGECYSNDQIVDLNE